MEEVEEFLADVCFYIVTVGRVEPCCVTSPRTISLVFGLMLFIFEIVVVAAFLEGFLVGRFGAFENSSVR
jgi:hypothetical protein